MSRSITCLIAILLLAGCSQRGLYENIQINHRNQCLKLPPTEYDRCMERNDKSYEEYQQELRDYERQRKEEEEGR